MAKICCVVDVIKRNLIDEAMHEPERIMTLF